MIGWMFYGAIGLRGLMALCLGRKLPGWLQSLLGNFSDSRLCITVVNWRVMHQMNGICEMHA